MVRIESIVFNKCYVSRRHYGNHRAQLKSTQCIYGVIMHDKNWKWHAHALFLRILDYFHEKWRFFS